MALLAPIKLACSVVHANKIKTVGMLVCFLSLRELPRTLVTQSGDVAAPGIKKTRTFTSTVDGSCPSIF